MFMDFDIAFVAQLPGTTQDHLQIFNIEMKAKMKSHQMPEQVKFICCQFLLFLVVVPLHSAISYLPLHIHCFSLIVNLIA